jgi:sugar (pentulose or hexulose) kinase
MSIFQRFLKTNMVFLDEEMEVIRPAILWSDTRTSEQCKEIYTKVGGLNQLIDYVSNPALEGFTAPKILWLKENEPENYQKVKCILLAKDYIRYRLTGELFTEVSDAAGTLLFEVIKKRWSTGLLRKLEIDPDLLPPILNSFDLAGRITKPIAEKTGLKFKTPLVAGGADNACGAVGSGIIQEGRVMVSIGSSGVVLEGVTFALKDSLELIKDKGVKIKEIRAIGGGAKSSVWQQILADILGEEINLLNVEEGPAFGAALIAGVGVGVYSSFAEAVNRIVKVKKTIVPRIQNNERYNQYYQLYKKLYFSLKENFKELKKLSNST